MEVYGSERSGKQSEACHACLGLPKSLKPRESEKSCRSLHIKSTPFHNYQLHTFFDLFPEKCCPSFTKMFTQVTLSAIWHKPSFFAILVRRCSICQDRRKALLSNLTDQLKQVLARTSIPYAPALRLSSHYFGMPWHFLSLWRHLFCKCSSTLHEFRINDPATPDRNREQLQARYFTVAALVPVENLVSFGNSSWPDHSCQHQRQDQCTDSCSKGGAFGSMISNKQQTWTRTNMDKQFEAPEVCGSITWCTGIVVESWSGSSEATAVANAPNAVSGHCEHFFLFRNLFPFMLWPQLGNRWTFATTLECLCQTTLDNRPRPAVLHVSKLPVGPENGLLSASRCVLIGHEPLEIPQIDFQLDMELWVMACAAVECCLTRMTWA